MFIVKTDIEVEISELCLLLSSVPASVHICKSSYTKESQALMSLLTIAFNCFKSDSES